MKTSQPKNSDRNFREFFFKPPPELCTQKLLCLIESYQMEARKHWRSHCVVEIRNEREQS